MARGNAGMGREYGPRGTPSVRPRTLRCGAKGSVLASESALVRGEVGSVAGAGRALERLAIEDGHRAARVADELAALQRARRFGDPHAPHSEHVRQEFVRDV